MDGYILTALLLAILALFIYRYWLIRMKEKAPTKQRGNPIGSSMTIGDREMQADYLGSVLGTHGALLVLADGVGSGLGSKIAAKTAVDTALELYQDYRSFDKPEYYFQRVFNTANHRILSFMGERQGETAELVVLLQGNSLYYALAGNIRMAVYRAGDLIPVSEGQTLNVLAENRYQDGSLSRDMALALLQKEERVYNLLGQEVFRGMETAPKPIRLEHGDVVVMMTDGVFRALTWRNIEEVLESGGTPNEIAGRLTNAVRYANQQDKDNASVLIYQN